MILHTSYYVVECHEMYFSAFWNLIKTYVILCVYMSIFLDKGAVEAFIVILCWLLKAKIPPEAPHPHISLSSSMIDSATVFFLSISFIKQVISSFPSNMQECTKISAKLYSRVMLKEYKTSPHNLGRFWRSSNKCQFTMCSFVFWLLYSIYKEIIFISVHH